MSPLVVFCADDFAMSEGITAGVEALAHEGRLSATSAIVTGPLWPEHAQRAAALRETIAIGLHLSLTWGKPLGPMPAFAPDGRFPTIGQLLPRSLAATLPRAEIADEFTRQLTAFMIATGRPPDFIDGHEHVHVLPVVRRALLSVLSKHAWAQGCIIRSPEDAPLSIVRRGTAVSKALLVSLLSRGFRSDCASNGYATNASFAGFSGFAADSDHATELARWFTHHGSRHLVMCHPADPAYPDLSGDPIAASRTESFRAIRAATWLPQRLWTRSTQHPDLWSQP